MKHEYWVKLDKIVVALWAASLLALLFVDAPGAVLKTAIVVTSLANFVTATGVHASEHGDFP